MFDGFTDNARLQRTDISGDVGEFWLFFLSITTFTVHVILAERRRLRESDNAIPD